MAHSDLVLSILQRAAAAVPGAMGIYDVHGGRVIPFGCASAALFGIRSEELARLDRTDLQALVHTDDRPRLAALAKRSMALGDGDSAAEHLRVKGADGDWCPVHLQTSVFARGPDARPVVILATATPDAAVGRQRRRTGMPAATDGWSAPAVLEALLEHVPERLMLTGAGPELPVLAHSRSARELFGRPVTRLADLPARGSGHRAFGLYEADGESAAALEDLPTYRAVRFGETVECEEWLVRRPDGTRSVVDVQVVPVRAGDAVVGTISIWRDASLRKQLEAAVREQAEQLGLLLRTTRIGWWRYELADSALQLSGECRELLGWPPERESSREQLLKVVHPADRTRVGAVFDGSRDDCSHFELELRITRPDGEERWVCLTTDCHSDDFGRPLRLFGVMADITEKKRLEAALQESEERFRALARGIAGEDRGRPVQPVMRKAAK